MALDEDVVLLEMCAWLETEEIAASKAGKQFGGEIPKPDHAIIIDTTRERSSTWDYLDAYTKPALESAGVTISRISSARYANTDLFENTRLLIPAFKLHGAGGKGKLPGLVRAAGRNAWPSVGHGKWEFKTRTCG